MTAGQIGKVSWTQGQIGELQDLQRLRQRAVSTDNRRKHLNNVTSSNTLGFIVCVLALTALF